MELDDELKSAFFAETDEHLEVLERLLGQSGWQAQDIAAAFRAMHSLKGLAQAVGLPNMQLLAHRAEDLLGIVRSGQARLEAPLVQVLLATTDRLRDMREFVLAHGVDAPEDAPLAGWLHRVVSGLAGDTAPATDPRSAPTSAPTGAVPLADDGEMLELYCELLEEQAPALALLISGDSTGRQLGREHAEALANGAEVMGFEQLAADLLDLAAPSPDPAGLPALYGLAAQLALLEEMTGKPAGGAALSRKLGEAAAQDADRALRALHRLLADGSDRASVATGARTARMALETAGRARAAELMLRLEEARAQPDDPEAEPLRDAARDLRLLAGIPIGGELDAAAAAALLAAWTSPVETRESVQLDLRPELRAVLTSEQSERLARRLHEGSHAYALLLDLESGETASDVIAWLSTGVEVVTNCTVPVPAALATGTAVPGQSWFEFLILSERTPEQLQAQLFGLDPDQLCVHGLRPVAADTRISTTLPETAGPDRSLATPGATSGTTAGATPGATPVIRVRVETIDRLMDEVSELRVAVGALGDAMRNGELAQDLRAARLLLDRLPAPTQAHAELLARLRGIERGQGALADLQESLEGLHRQVWNSCMELRVVPADSLFARFPRLVRELSQRLGKEVDLELQGREVRLDKSTADLLVDPLMHMIRNALDHGVEPVAARLAAGKPARARLVLAAAEQGEGVAISLADDGAGLSRAAILERAIGRGLVASGDAAGLSDRDVFDFLFSPGFSTADRISETSGRGVGLDVVAAVVERLDGRIELETEPGRGTRFVLALPSSASLQNVLLVQVPQTLAIPERDVVTALLLSEARLDPIGRRPTLWHEDGPVPLVSLAAIMGLGEAPRSDASCAVIVAAGRERLALLVDAVPQRRELFLKELHPLLARLPAIAGAAVLGSGQPVLVLDVAGLMELSRPDG